MDHGMDHLPSVLDYETIKIEQLIGPKGPNQLNMADIPVERVVPYMRGADVTLQLAGKLMPEIEASGLRHVCYDVEFPLIPVLVDMEFADSTGQRHWKILEAARSGDCQSGARTSMKPQVGGLTSTPKQLGDVLYKDL